MSRFISIAEAREAGGLRMACIRGVPTPWTEAAKGIFHVKALPCQFAAQGEGDTESAIADWAGNSSVPVVAFEREPLRTGWAEILLLAERLAPEPALIPADAGLRAQMFGISHEICGEMGFGWCLRLNMIKLSMGHSDVSGGGRFPPAVAGRLAAKYGFNPQHVAEAGSRVIAVLGLLDQSLEGKRYLLGETLTAADIYWATFANLMNPLPEAELPAVPLIRDVYSCRDEELNAALTPRLKDHQSYIYQRYLELPVPL